MEIESINKIRTVSFSWKQAWAMLAGFCTIMGTLIYFMHVVDMHIIGEQNFEQRVDTAISGLKIQGHENNTLIQHFFDKTSVIYVPVDTNRYTGDYQATLEPIKNNFDFLTFK